MGVARHFRHRIAIAAAVTLSSTLGAQSSRAGNPVLPGWYADPEAHVFQGEYWIYPTYSAPYNQQVHMDAFSSRDLVTWTKHERIIDTASVKWAKRAMWAPSIIEKDGWYYLFFGANDIQNDQQAGGIGVARSRSPSGPFVDHIGKPLIDAFHNGAQPIDQMVFRDATGVYYIVYGGWKHCNIARLNDDFTALVPFTDGTTYKEITPPGYVEGAYMLVKDGKYYFMWSEGGWTGPDYAVACAVGSSPFGPFERVGKILQQDAAVATGAGHHSILHAPGSDKWYIVYHRRPLGETDRNHRVVSIDELHFDATGMIQPVKITSEGVLRDPLATSTSRAQPGDCTYATCALRLERGWFSSSLVRGQTGQRVDKLNGSGGGVQLLLQGGDSSAWHAQRYVYASRRSAFFGGLGALSYVAVTLRANGRRHDVDALDATLAVTGGLAFIASAPFALRANNELSRAVWWYNAALPR